MARTIIMGLFLKLSLCSFAQTTNIMPHVAMTNGADIKTMFDGNKRILSVKVQNNDDDVEILAVDKGNIIDREKTFFQNDELEMDLSYRSIPTLDIYARTRNELQYIGTVETGAK